ncbi:MAG: heme exporter protein CcmB [Deltaproteobacteria bacterium]|nr:heme exporter protein CcmB [Deltaproteobacteria bacterium]
MKNSFFPTLITLFKKELLLAARSSHPFVSVVFFTFLIVLVFHFGFSISEKEITRFIPSFIWLSTIFGGMLRLSQTFEPENEGQVLDGMRQIPGIAVPFFLTKFLFNFLFLILLELFTFIMLVVLFNITAPVHFLIANWPPFILGALGLASIGTVFSNMVISHNRKEIILAVISYPILVPLIIGVLKSFVFSQTGDIIELDTIWLKTLAVFDIVYLLLSIMVFDTVLKA